MQGDRKGQRARARRFLSNVVHIGETPVQASPPLYRGVRLGHHVPAKVSSGSDFIRQLERNPTPSSK
jgi:hypothetical protein